MDFIDHFVTLTDNGLSTERFRRWSAICTIAALLNRNVWTSIRAGKPLFPNLYTLLVGPPASGKTQAMLFGRHIIETQEELIVAPDSGSKEMFIKTLAEGEQGPRKRGVDDASTIALFLSEWGTFMKDPDNQFCAMMAQIYDCDIYKHDVLSRKTDLAENIYVNICACCTTAWFAEGFPANSWEQGLPTRFQFIYDDTLVGEDDFSFEEAADRDVLDPVTNALFNDACRITSVRGFMKWSPEAGRIFNEWKEADFDPIPNDPMLSGYAKRRPLHVAKLATIMAISAHPNKLEIQGKDFERARHTLLEAETVMGKALIMAGGNIFQGRVEATIAFVKTRFKERAGKSVPEWEVRQQLSRLVPPYMVGIILGEMLASKRMSAIGGTTAPNREFKPI